MQSCDCPRILRCILRCILGLTMLMVCAGPLVAQTPPETPAHRVLELPKNGSADLHKQMFLLQQLQALLSGQQPHAKPPSTPPANSTPSALPEQLQNLKQLYDQFGGQIPEGLLPKPEDIPPELIEQVKSNPQLKRQVQQMLEQYKRDGRLPNSDGGGGFQMPLPPTDGSQPQRALGPNPDTSVRPADRRPDPRPNGSRPLQPDQQTQPPTEDSQRQNPEDSSRRSEALQYLQDIWDKANPQQSDDAAPRPGTRPNSRPGIEEFPKGGDMPADSSAERPQTGKQNGRSADQSPGDSDANPRLPDTTAGWDKLLNDMIQQQRDGANGNTPDQNQSPGSQANGPNNGQQPGQSTNRRADKPSVQEFLEQMRDVVPPDFNPSPTTANSASDTGAAAQDARDTQAAREDVIKRQQETSESLRDKGLKATLKKIVKEAQQKAKEDRAQALADGQAGNSNQPGSGGMSSAMLETLEGIRKDVFEMVKDGDITIGAKSGNGDNGGSDAQSPAAARPEKSESMLGGFRAVAGELISDLSAPEPPAADVAASADSILPATEFSLSGWIVPLLMLALIGMFLTWLAWRMGLLNLGGVLSSNPPAISSDQVRTKADVVRAFHSMALKPIRKTQAWWTHQMVQQDMTAQSPEKTYQVSVLAELYEHARYLPDEQDFTAQQIQEARRALQQCEER